MNFVPTHDQIIEVDSFASLVDNSQRVQDGSSLAVVMHDAFETAQLPTLASDVRKSRSLHDGDFRIKSSSGRHAVEFNSKGFLPIINASDQPFGQDHRILPPDVVATVRAVHGISTTTQLDGPIRFQMDEFRSPHDVQGLIHIDKSDPDSDLTVHITAVGAGVMNITQLSDSAPEIPLRGKKFFEPDGIYKKYMRTPDFYRCDVRAGTVVVFAAEGNALTGRKPTVHNFTTTSAFRSSVAIDHAEVMNGAPRLRAVRKLRRSNIVIDDYLSA